MPTRHANLHVHDSLRHTLPDDDLDDSQHRTSASPLPSTIILVHRFHDDNAMSPLRVASPSGNRPPPRRRRHVCCLHPVALLTDGRPPRGASSPLPEASVASDFQPRSDTNCWNSPTDQSHKAKRTHAILLFIAKRAYRTL
jgi:hypothetical protein